MKKLAVILVGIGCLGILALFGWRALAYGVAWLVTSILFGLGVGRILRANSDRDDEIGW